GQSLGPVDGFFCGGVIIDPTHIATAAHCVFDDTTGQATSPSRLHVLAGTRDLAAPGTAPAAGAASFDPRYNPNTNHHATGVVPLVAAATASIPSSYQLAGLVESGEGCADPNFAGIYDKVSNIDVRTFLTSNPPTAPQQQVPTSISESGKTFICDPGQWANAG